jgi:hypothetical protein
MLVANAGTLASGIVILESLARMCHVVCVVRDMMITGLFDASTA